MNVIKIDLKRGMEDDKKKKNFLLLVKILGVVNVRYL